MRRLPPTMLLVSPGNLSREDASRGGAGALESLPQRAREAFRAGAQGLLLREPQLEDGAFLALARELRGLMDREVPGGWLGLHDRAHLAAAAGADGLHLAGSSLGVAEARTVVGASLAIGVSTHDGDGPARWEGADYAMHAPVFPPNSKHGEAAPLGAQGLARFCGACSLPVWALGGITAERLPELSRSGAAGAAGIGAVWSGDLDPGAEGPGRLGRRVGALVEAAAAALGLPPGDPR